MNRLFKKISIISIVFLSGILVFSGCSNKIKKQMDLAINYLNSGKYSEAKKELDGVLKEDSTNSEAKLLTEIINDFETANELFNNRDFNKANEEISKIPKEYVNYNIKNDIEKLKSNVNKSLDEIKEFNSNLDKINKLINDGKLDEAKKEIEDLKNKDVTVDEDKKLNDLTNALNKKLDEKAKEEKILKEKKQLELEQKKKAEEVSKKEKEATKQTVAKKREIYTNNNSKNNENTDEDKSKPYVYRNTKLGLQMTIPASWKGLYTIKSDNDAISLWVKSQKGKFKHSDGGFLFAVTKYKSKEDEDFEDTVGNKRFVIAKGIKYIIGGPTGVTMSQDNPDWNIYLRLNHEKHSVADTIKAIE